MGSRIQLSSVSLRRRQNLDNLLLTTSNLPHDPRNAHPLHGQSHQARRALPRLHGATLQLTAVHSRHAYDDGVRRRELECRRHWCIAVPTGWVELFLVPVEHSELHSSGCWGDGEDVGDSEGV